MPVSPENLNKVVREIIKETPVFDIHTHLFPPEFGKLLLWGIDELLVYHYLIAESFRWLDIPYEAFWKMSKKEQAELVWQTMFIANSPISESTRGVLTVLKNLGIDTSNRDLNAVREEFAKLTAEEYVDTVFRLSNVRGAVMTNDPFDDQERPLWEGDISFDPRFKTALRIDSLLNDWPAAVKRLREWGYNVSETFSDMTLSEVRRFLTDWIERLDALYLAASLPPTFTVPDDSPRSRLIADCVLPVCRERNKPFAMMIGVKKLVNPDLRLGGDSVGRGRVETVEYLCANYPDNKFMVTMLARENQHELCVVARKFRNLLIFGCWWFLNTPSLIDEMTRMRIELLGISTVLQHSDARVIDQLIYKWDHSRKVIGDVLCEKYADLAATGWVIEEDEIRRDVANLLGGTFDKFCSR